MKQCCKQQPSADAFKRGQTVYCFFTHENVWVKGFFQENESNGDVWIRTVTGENAYVQPSHVSATKPSERVLETPEQYRQHREMLCVCNDALRASYSFETRKTVRAILEQSIFLPHPQALFSSLKADTPPLEVAETHSVEDCVFVYDPCGTHVSARIIEAVDDGYVVCIFGSQSWYKPHMIRAALPEGKRACNTPSQLAAFKAFCAFERMHVSCDDDQPDTVRLLALAAFTEPFLKKY